MKMEPEKLPNGAQAGTAHPKGDRVTRKDCTDCAKTHNTSELSETMLGSKDLPSTLHWEGEDVFPKIFFLLYFT